MASGASGPLPPRRRPRRQPGHAGPAELQRYHLDDDPRPVRGVIDVGRRTRKIPPALRRALRERDRGRCCYPGCGSRRTDAHHIRHWANGGPTSLANLISFCRRHHRLVHAQDDLIVTDRTGFAFYTRDGTPIPACPPLPRGPGDITTSHDAVIRPTTIVPPHSGERFDLSLAIWIAFANARTQAARAAVTS